jgi:hypothetical protein
LLAPKVASAILEMFEGQQTNGSLDYINPRLFTFFLPMRMFDGNAVCDSPTCEATKRKATKIQLFIFRHYEHFQQVH